MSTSRSGEKPRGKPARTTAEPEEQTDIILDFWARLSRFGSDVLGVLLLSVAVLTVLGLTDLTQGLLINPWVALIKTAFGWAVWLIPLVFALLGVICFRGHFRRWPKVSLGRILALEGLVFVGLTLLAIFNGLNLQRAEAGEDGGVIGWGLGILLERVLPAPWSIVFLVVLGLFLAGLGLGLLQWAFRGIESWVGEFSRRQPAPPKEKPQPVPERTAPVAEVEPATAVLPLARDPRLPPLNLLMEEQSSIPDEKVILETGRRIEQTLAEFGLPVKVMGYRIGPTVTQFAVEPGYVEKTGADGEDVQQKVRVAQISALQRDLALRLSAERLRIEAPVPGHSYVGIEVPNPKNTIVRLRPLMQSEEFRKLGSPLAIALGRDVSGQPLVVDLTRMPHMLIAGTTGSGKSVCIGAIITCLAVNNHPERLRMALLDPKMVELVRFNGLPHLFGKVETDVDRMLGVLKWALAEMDNRYRVLEDAHARDIDTYNRRAERRREPQIPKIVLIVDELADLMMSAPEQTEHSLVRLAQMARAVGIHLVVATQRPSADVVTGLIKANFPARLSFTVASSVDSRVVLDTPGAENLLGKGDMLFLSPEVGAPARAQGVMVSDEEIARIEAFWKQSEAPDAGEAAPWEELIQAAEESAGADDLVQQAAAIVRRAQKASASMLQRRLRIGYPRAARLMDELEEMGIIGPAMNGKEREVLVDPEEDDEEDGGAEQKDG